jgi:Ca-activated chloride channel homolog
VSFRWPAVLWTMLLAPAAVVGYVAWLTVRARRRVRLASRCSALGAVSDDGTTGRSRRGWRRHLIAGLVLLAMVSLLLAGARPYSVVVKRQRQGTIELVIDTSGTMHAPDVRPTRLDATQQAILRFVDRIPGDWQIGVVGFAGAATTRTRPTTDRDTIRRVILSLRASGPSAMADGLRRALDDLQAATRWVRRSWCWCRMATPKAPTRWVRHAPLVHGTFRSTRLPSAHPMRRCWARSPSHLTARRWPGSLR